MSENVNDPAVLEKLKVAELQEIATEEGIETDGLKKAELIAAILGTGNPENGDAESDDEIEGKQLSVANAPIVIGHAAYHFDGPVRKVVARDGRIDVHYANGDREEITDNPSYKDAEDFQRQYEERFGVKLESRGS